MTTPPAPRPRRRVGEWITGLPRALARIPVALLTIALLLAAGIATGTLFTAADPNDAAITSLEFGLPAFREGRLWTLFTGAVTFTEPEFYYFVGAMLAVGLGVYERRVGSVRAACALLISHCAGIVVPALLLWPFANSDWTWASTLAGELDAGLSAGGFGVAAAATALLNPPWRGRLRVVGTTFLAVMVIKSGLLWDLEHLAAWATGLAIGPWLARSTMRARRLRTAAVSTGSAGPSDGRVPSPAEARVLISLIIAGLAVSNVVESFYPGLGGLIGPGVGSPEVRGGALIILELVISLLVVGALPAPRALAWWVALVAVTAIAVNSVLNTPLLPKAADAVCALVVLAVLIWNRNAWPWRSDRTARRPLALLVTVMLVFAAVTSVAVWAVREQFRPVPKLGQLIREAVSRFTFTTGPLVPLSNSARGVIVLTGGIWALTLIVWLVWALYLQRPAGWRWIRQAVRNRTGSVAGSTTRAQRAHPRGNGAVGERSYSGGQPDHEPSEVPRMPDTEQSR